MKNGILLECDRAVGRRNFFFFFDEFASADTVFAVNGNASCKI